MNSRVADWPHASLGELARGGAFSDGDWIETKDQDPSGDVRLTQLADVGVATFRDRSNRWLREDQAARLGCTFLEPNDILIARMPDPIGRACLVPTTVGRAVTAVDVAVLRIRRADVDPRFVMWAINSPDFHARVVALESGTTRKRISRRNLSALTVPLPPLEEQRRIVDILEDHLSRLDAAGRLLSGVALRTHALMRSALRSEFGESNAKYRTRLTDVATIINGTTPSGLKDAATADSSDAGAVPFWKVGDMNLADGRSMMEARTYVQRETAERLRLRLAPVGTVVFPKRGGAIATNKKRLLAVEGAFDLNTMGVAPGPALLPAYLLEWFEHLDLRTLADGSNVPQINTPDIARLVVPVPSPDQQIAAVNRLAEIEASIERIAVTQWAERADSLRRALLGAAFSGRLTGASSDAYWVEELAGV